MRVKHVTVGPGPITGPALRPVIIELFIARTPTHWHTKRNECLITEQSYNWIEKNDGQDNDRSSAWIKKDRKLSCMLFRRTLTPLSNSHQMWTNPVAFQSPIFEAAILNQIRFRLFLPIKFLQYSEWMEYSRFVRVWHGGRDFRFDKLSIRRIYFFTPKTTVSLIHILPFPIYTVKPVEKKNSFAPQKFIIIFILSGEKIFCF